MFLFVAVVIFFGGCSSAQAFTYSSVSPTTTAVSYSGVCYANATDASYAFIQDYPRVALGNNTSLLTDAYNLDSVTLTGSVAIVQYTGVSGTNTLTFLPCDLYLGFHYFEWDVIEGIGLVICFGLGYLIAVVLV